MGAYLYRTSPSLTARAVVQMRDGSGTVECDVALYRYAYKPSYSDPDFNRRMDFKTGVHASANAFARTGKPVPDLGMNYDDEAGEVYALRGVECQTAVFRTRGAPAGTDDHDFCTYVGDVVSWVRLPKGIKSRPAVGASAA